MSMSTHVVGFAPPDEKWRSMKAIWDACKVARVDPPQEVIDFFGGEEPDDEGVEVDLEATSWHDRRGGREGVEIEVAKIPAHIKTIRFFNSW